MTASTPKAATMIGGFVHHRAIGRPPGVPRKELRKTMKRTHGHDCESSISHL